MDEDWDEIIMLMKRFARIENITDIILLGDGVGEGQGVRRITISESTDKIGESNGK